MKKQKPSPKKKAESIEGQEIDLEELQRYSGWRGEEDKITIFSEKGDKILAVVSVDTLINCWIEIEKEAYQETQEPSDQTRKKTSIRCKNCGHELWLEGLHTYRDPQTNECLVYNKKSGVCGCCEGVSK